MAEKKKAPAKGGADEDESTQNILKYYRRKCDQNGIQQLCKLFKDKVDKCLEEGTNLQQIVLYEEIGPVGIRSIFDALYDLDYQHVKVINVWKAKSEDEGVRSICNFIVKTKNINKLDLLENQITPLGCQFLSRVLLPNSQLLKIKLDHNLFGDEGLHNLSVSLAINNTLEKLSMNYCGITQNGAKCLQQLLANIDTHLIKLKLQGNQLKNEGVNDIFRALQCNNTVEVINLADNQIEETDKFIESMVNVMNSNQNCGSYIMKFNDFRDETAKAIIEVLKETRHIYVCDIGDHISKVYADEIKNLMKKNKPKKKGKKGKKPKKK